MKVVDAYGRAIETPSLTRRIGRAEVAEEEVNAISHLVVRGDASVRWVGAGGQYRREIVAGSIGGGSGEDGDPVVER
jgi:hypothetical protein